MEALQTQINAKKTNPFRRNFYCCVPIICRTWDGHMEVVVIRWENAEWGIAYRDPKKGTLYSERIGTRQEARARAAEVRKEWKEKGRPQRPGAY
jgi:hypothetical protein